MRVLVLLTALVLGVSCSTIPRPEWTRSNNALSAKLVFEIEDKGKSAKIIHPKVFLRNDSGKPINFFECIYHSGRFNVRNSDGSEVGFPPGMTRSGPHGAKVVEIQPGEIFELNTYDYGYGMSTNREMYTFNTSSYQRNLKPGEYLVDYSLDFEKKALKKILKDYDWIKADPGSFWTGQIIIRDVKMSLK